MAFTFVVSMSKIVKIKENHIFRRAYKRGTSLVSPYVVLYIMKTRRQDIRLGITAGKKIGKAVSRNRAKRVITAAFRECLPQIPAGYDFIIVARTRILSAKSTAVAASMRSLLKNAGVIEALNDEKNTD